jgi:hypothetical protein
MVEDNGKNFISLGMRGGYSQHSVSYAAEYLISLDDWRI